MCRLTGVVLLTAARVRRPEKRKRRVKRRSENVEKSNRQIPKLRE